MKFKLKDGIENSITVQYMEKHGVSSVYTSKTFEPGKVYGFPGDDDVAERTLLSYKTRVPKTESIINLFNEKWIEYTLVKPSCQCQKVPFVEFSPVVEVSDESD